jgi:predicted DsbA family dithiol-disulfide isomerase
MAMDTPRARTPVTIDVVSDVVCPWCYLGKHRLAAGLGLVPEVTATVRWRPFLLDPTIPAGGISREEYIRRKFGNPERVEGIHQSITALGRELGIDYRFDRIRRSPNTVDAHRLVLWVDGERQDTAVEALFRAYFTDGRDVGDHAVLAGIAAEIGMDRDRTAARLDTDEDRTAVLDDIAYANEIGVTGVPCFIIGRRYAVMGAEAPETIAAAIRQAVGETAGAPTS